ncbi:MAG: aminopeptidase P family protein [Cytophagales bacterium]
MKYLPINNKLFIENRKRLAARMKPNAVAIFNSNDIMPTNADGTMLFRQNSDIFYFSGVDQEESTLLLFPDAPKPEWKEILFIRETNEQILTWEGHKLDKSQAKEVSGIDNVVWNESMAALLPQIIFEADHIYLNSNEHPRSSNQVQTSDERFIQWIKSKFPLHHLERLAPILSELRAIKQSIEIELINAAIDITKKAFLRVLNFAKPGVTEYEIEAEITHEFIKNRATRHAYTPIIASGSDACVLHYNENNKVCKDGDLLLLDFGAEYANYAADLTRTIPINGKFTDRQKQVYKSVLHIQAEAQKMLVEGTILDEYHKEVGKIAEAEMIKLGLLNQKDVKEQDPEKPLYKKYFMHGTSHFLGLDVHDVGKRFKPMQSGMVFTCEPGIYIKDEKFGIRLENNILITKTGNINLMEKIPVLLEDIEALMKD